MTATTAAHRLKVPRARGQDAQARREAWTRRLPLLLNPYQQYVLNTALVYVPVGIGFNLVVGNLGLLAFSNVAYFGLGAYTSGILMAQLGLPWWITLVPAALIVGLRPKRHY